jgi:hypothetical protein
MTTPVWLFLTWEWLKRYWKWLLLPLGILLWFLGRATAKKEVTVTSTALAESDTAKAAIDAKALEQTAQADAKEAAQLAVVTSQRSAAVAAATQTQIDAASAAQGDSGAVNSILTNVGKDMRR